MTTSARRMAPVDEQMAALMRGTEFGDEMTRRNMERELRARLEEDRPLSVYCGYDPTSVDLTLGHTLTMRKLRQFQDFGHNVTFLIGNFTGLVGDASDKDKRRPMLTAQQLAANAATYEKQAGRILDLSRTTITYNADWLGALTFADVVKLCSHFTVAEFLKRDNFAKRMERGDAIHLHEFMYAIMQAYDAVALNTDVQVGGTEQLFNLMAGRKLQEEFDQRPQIVLMVPILVGTDGHQRMSKSTGNYIGVDEAPNDMFGKVMSLPDVAMRDYFTLLTDLPADQVESQLAGAPIEAKKQLAYEITASMYDRQAAAAARTYFESTFQRGETPEEMQEFTVDGEAAPRLDHVLRTAGLAASAAEVRRLVAQGAVRVNGNPVTDFALTLRGGDEVRVGRHRFLRMVEAGGKQVIDGGYDIDLEAVNQNVDEAEVVTFYFPMLRRTLLVDMRSGPLEGPLISVVAMVDSSAQRYDSLRRLRPQLPRPESLTMIPWAHSIGALESTGVWERVTGRLLGCGGSEVLMEAGRCLRELRVLELNELRLAIRGAEYRTVWGRAGVGDGAEPPAAV